MDDGILELITKANNNGIFDEEIIESLINEYNRNKNKEQSNLQLEIPLNFWFIPFPVKIEFINTKMNIYILLIYNNNT